MIKILVANEDVKQNLHCCEFLTNDKRFEVIGTNNGTSTLKKYLEIKPDILVLNSHFNDMNFNEIIDRISVDINEKKIANIIMITNNKEEQLSIVDTAKIYKIIPRDSDINYEKLLNTINEYCSENNFTEIDNDYLQRFLLRLNFNLSNGTDYLIEAIKLCYYFPSLLKSLDSTFLKVAYQFKTSSEAIRSSIRTALIKVNNTRNDFVLKLFGTEDISPKYFLYVIVTYLHLKEKEKNKK